MTMAAQQQFDRPFPAFTSAQRWHFDVFGFAVVPDTLLPAECARLHSAVLALRDSLLASPAEAVRTHTRLAGARAVQGPGAASSSRATRMRRCTSWHT